MIPAGTGSINCLRRSETRRTRFQACIRRRFAVKQAIGVQRDLDPASLVNRLYSDRRRDTACSPRPRTRRPARRLARARCLPGAQVQHLALGTLVAVRRRGRRRSVCPDRAGGPTARFDDRPRASAKIRHQPNQVAPAPAVAGSSASVQALSHRGRQRTARRPRPLGAADLSVASLYDSPLVGDQQPAAAAPGTATNAASLLPPSRMILVLLRLLLQVAILVANILALLPLRVFEVLVANVLAQPAKSPSCPALTASSDLNSVTRSGVIAELPSDAITCAFERPVSDCRQRSCCSL